MTTMILETITFTNNTQDNDVNSASSAESLIVIKEDRTCCNLPSETNTNDFDSVILCHPEIWLNCIN